MRLKTMVENVLRDIPESRNSDITLMIEVWKRYYPRYLKRAKTGEYGVYLPDLYELPREDNIKRARAQFNASGKYYPTEYRVLKARKLNEDRWRKENGYPPYGTVSQSSKGASYTQEAVRNTENV